MTDRRRYVLELTRAQRHALVDIITYAITGPGRLEVYVDIHDDTRTEVRPADLLELVLDARFVKDQPK